MSFSPARNKLRAQIASTARHRPEADLTDLRRDYAAEKLAEYVSKVVAEAPPLTPAQRDRLTVLLRGGAS